MAIGRVVATALLFGSALADVTIDSVQAALQEDDACAWDAEAGEQLCGVELFQQRLRLRTVQGSSEEAGCPEDKLVGEWNNKDALGFKTINIGLTVDKPKGAGCQGVHATIVVPSYLGGNRKYVLTMTPASGGKFNVKYYNPTANPPYFHLGEYDPATDTLTEDLGHLNGKKMEPFPGSTTSILKFSRE
mmetsp:Transcript_36881/g.106205  ORF Transcript_36881/g.106205 Transcript_36881/m.106205 type:complete len:189 (-) Transcript_36881:104-670(-)